MYTNYVLCNYWLKKLSKFFMVGDEEVCGYKRVKIKKKKWVSTISDQKLKIC